jgi:hypothetical protein
VILDLERPPDKMIVRDGDKYIRKITYGYMKATSPNGRAHFYAPYKSVGNQEIDTFWFNLAVVWIESVFLYMILCFNLFGKFISWLGRLSVKKVDIPQ